MAREGASIYDPEFANIWGHKATGEPEVEAGNTTGETSNATVELEAKT